MAGSIRASAMSETVLGARARGLAKWRLALVPFDSVSGTVAAFVLLAVIIVAVFAPALSPYDPLRNNTDAAGQLLRLQPPSTQHWLGTTYYGLDVLSQLIYGTRIVLVVGLTCAALIALVGTNVGLLAGYYGGAIETVLMRATDFAFGIPFIPFAVVLVALLGPSLSNTIVAISLLMW